MAAPADAPEGATVHDITALVAAQTGDQSASFTALSRTSAALFQPVARQRPGIKRNSMPGIVEASARSDSTLDSPASTAPTQRGLPDGDADRDEDEGTTHLTEREHRWVGDLPAYQHRLVPVDMDQGTATIIKLKWKLCIQRIVRDLPLLSPKATLFCSLMPT